MSGAGPRSSGAVGAGAAARPRTLGETHSPLGMRLAEALREAMAAGRYKPGERLIEDRLAEEMGVSRIPVREALRVLSAEGWVDITPRRGATVAALSRAVALEMIEVRATLEGLNARLAARHRDDRIVAELTAVLAEGNKAAARGDNARLAALNARFHDLLGEAGSNSVLSDMMRLLRDRTTPFFAAMSRRRAREIWVEHAGILQAVIAGEEDKAGRLASDHVSNAGAHVLASIGEPAGTGAQAASTK